MHEEARVPEKAHANDAGFDFFTLNEVILPPGETVKVRTGIASAFSDTFVLLLWDKSSIGAMGIKTLGGVVDAGYRGEIQIMLHNLHKEPITLKKGQKVAQGVLQKVEHVEVRVVDELPESMRGEGGFGSTGTH